MWKGFQSRLHRILPFPKYSESLDNLGKMKKGAKEHSGSTLTVGDEWKAEPFSMFK